MQNWKLRTFWRHNFHKTDKIKQNFHQNHDIHIKTLYKSKFRQWFSATVYSLQWGLQRRSKRSGEENQNLKINEQIKTSKMQIGSFS